MEKVDISSRKRQKNNQPRKISINWPISLKKKSLWTCMYFFIKKATEEQSVNCLLISVKRSLWLWPTVHCALLCVGGETARWVCPGCIRIQQHTTAASHLSSWWSQSVLLPDISRLRRRDWTCHRCFSGQISLSLIDGGSIREGDCAGVRNLML